MAVGTDATRASVNPKLAPNLPIALREAVDLCAHAPVASLISLCRGSRPIAGAGAGSAPAVQTAYAGFPTARRLRTLRTSGAITKRIAAISTAPTVSPTSPEPAAVTIQLAMPDITGRKAADAAALA